MRTGLGGWGHLAARLFEVAAARELSPREQAEVAGLLRPEESRCFWGQPAADQRHGLAAARHVLRAAPGRRDLARAALLHDVGKRHARLGPLGRSIASALAKVGLPAGRRGRLYLEHPALGAWDLWQVGAEALVVDFARRHHQEPPLEADLRDWALLRRSDRAKGAARRDPPNSMTAR
ncbi:MAG: hypothetical protein ACRDWX_10965 [Acidimicrobiia bacterium]